MKFKLSLAAVLSALLTIQTFAAEPVEQPDDEKVSYALGMNLGLQIKRMAADVDMNVLLQAIKDVREGKPTQLKAAELRPIFQKEEAIQHALLSKKNKTEGDAFLTKNAKEPGVIVLPDGLQYKILKPGTGPIPQTDDNVTVNFRGILLNGKEVDHKENFQLGVQQKLKGYQEALQLMTVGSKWQVVAPPALAFGSEWNGDVGPDSTVIFEIELISIEPSVHNKPVVDAAAYGRQQPQIVGRPDASTPAPVGK